MKAKNNLHTRLISLAKKLHVTPKEDVTLERDKTYSCWWLINCVEGDVALPFSQGAKTIYDALEQTESWLHE